MLDSPGGVCHDPAGASLSGALLLAYLAAVPRARRLLLILAGYFDESGTHDKAEAITVAGYLSTPERWEAFEREWKAALEEFRIPFFHMADFCNGASSYRDWGPELKLERFDRLVKIINAHVLMSVGYTILVSRYRALFSPKARRAGGGAYGLVANCCFIDVAEYCRENHPYAWVRYFFESGAAGAGEILKNFQLNARIPQQKEYYRTLALSFEDKRSFCQLQAADILAYELYRHLPRQLGLDTRSGTRRELQALAVPPKRWRTLDDAELSKWALVLDAYAEFQKLPKRERRELLKRYPPWGAHALG
jgi:hypothetical protein